MRVIKHPILDELDTSARVTIFYNGQPVEALEGEPIAAALINAGITAFRTTQKRGEPRGIFCAIGRCTDCMMVVDGHPNTTPASPRSGTACMWRPSTGSRRQKTDRRQRQPERKVRDGSL